MLINFRLLVPLEHAGRVIGRSGEVIKQIRQQTSARVKMHEPTDGEAEQGCAGGPSSRLGSGLMHATTCTIALMVRHKEVCSGEQSRSVTPSTHLLYYLILLDTIFSICHLDVMQLRTVSHQGAPWCWQRTDGSHLLPCGSPMSCVNWLGQRVQSPDL